MHSTLRLFALLLAVATCNPIVAAAQGKCVAVSPDCVAVGEWDLNVALGAGVRTNPVADRSDIPLFVIPQLSYYGKRFFIDSLEPGVTVYEGAKNTVNLIAAPGYDRVFFSRGDLQNVFVSGPLASVGNGTVVPHHLSRRARVAVLLRTLRRAAQRFARSHGATRRL
jgi:MipA family protein